MNFSMLCLGKIGAPKKREVPGSIARRLGKVLQDNKQKGQNQGTNKRNKPER